MIVIDDRRYTRDFVDWLDQRYPGFASVEGSITVVALVDVQPGDFATEEDVLAVTAFTRWTHHSCEATIAVNTKRTPVTSRSYIWSVFDYVFNHCNRSVMYTYVSVENEKSISLQHKLGLKKKAVLTDHFGTGKDAILFAITRDDWQSGRWASRTKS